MRFYRHAVEWETVAVGAPGTVWTPTSRDARRLSEVGFFVQGPSGELGPGSGAWQTYWVDVDERDVVDLTIPPNPDVELLDWARALAPSDARWARFIESTVLRECLIRISTDPAVAHPL